jgi:predicted ATPase
MSYIGVRIVTSGDGENAPSIGASPRLTKAQRKHRPSIRELGNPMPVPELPAADARRRFQLLLRRFIGVFARPEHPLALFFDDLQ